MFKLAFCSQKQDLNRPILLSFCKPNQQTFIQLMNFSEFTYIVVLATLSALVSSQKM